MPFESYRSTKVAGLIGRHLAELIQHELQDPRLGLVTISDVNVSNDLSFADVYFTILPNEKSNVAERVLSGASGFLRRALASRISLRTTPKLRFHYDQTSDTGARIANAIDRAIASDRANDDG